MKKRIYYIVAATLILALCMGSTACFADESVIFVESTGDEQQMTEEATEQGMMSNDEKASDAATDVLSTDVVFLESKKIAVHVCGAVMLPGLYELADGCRVMDAVQMAGGFTENADEEYLNLAMLLSDGDKVRIPTQEEVRELEKQENKQDSIGVTNSKNGIKPEETGSGKVNINSAGVDELCTLPGIGKTRAESILSYRNEHGEFARIEDIMKISGIKESSFQKIKDKITVK